MAYRDWNIGKETDSELEDALKFVEKLRSAKEAGNNEDELLSSVYRPQFIAFQTIRTDEEIAEEFPATAVQISPATAGEADTPPADSISRGRRILERLFPVAGEPWQELVRKLTFLVVLLVFLGSMVMLLNEALIIPQQNEDLTKNIQQLMIESHNGELTPEEEAYDGYPEGISTDFKKLYYLNPDVRGWITYPGCSIDRWVMYSSVPEYYLYRDIYKNNNKNGSLFFDVNNNITSASSRYKSLVIYGHNMASGQMFAKLNDLAKSLSAMRSGCTLITLDTLYNSAQYKIFAVVIQDPNAKIEHYYSIQATSFADDASFLSYVDGLRARSLYDFNSVDIKASDELLILYTCSPTSVAGFNDARLAVVARKVRDGESATTDTSKITQNTDVLMPYAWYVAQKKTIPAAYKTGSSTTTKTTTGKQTTGGSTSLKPSGSTTGTTLPASSGSTTSGGSTAPDSSTASSDSTTAVTTTPPTSADETTASATSITTNVSSTTTTAATDTTTLISEETSTTLPEANTTQSAATESADKPTSTQVEPTEQGDT